MDATARRVAELAHRGDGRAATLSRISLEAQALFTRQLSAMVDAGIPIPQALAFFAEGEEGELGRAVEAVTKQVNSGQMLSRAMRNQPALFSEVYVALIESGERSGQIHAILRRLSDLLEKQVRMQKRLVATLTYPAMLLTVSLACTLVFVMFILPLIEPVFLGMHVPLPLPTRILLATRRLFLPVVAGLALLGLGLWGSRSKWQAYLQSNPVLHRDLARFPLQLPLVGDVLRKLITSRMLYALSTMLDAGMTLLEALSRSGAVSGNAWIKHRVGVVARGRLVDGESVTRAFEVSEVFPRTAVALLAVGEETSTLPRMIAYAATMYEEDADLALTMLSQSLEPLLMAGMGLIVGFIVVASMLPMLALVTQL